MLYYPTATGITHGGLKHLIKYYKDNAMARKPILLFTSEDIFLKRYEFNWNTQVGLDVDREIMEQHFDVVTPEPLWLTKTCVIWD